MTLILETIDEYRQHCAHQAHKIALLEAEIRWLKEQVRLAQRKIFGTSSEKSSAEQQEQIFNEAEVMSEPIPEPTVEAITYKRRKAKGHREAQIQNLEVIILPPHCLAKEDQICGCCGGPLHKMSEEVRDEIKIVPAKAYRERRTRYVYSCRQCEKNEISTRIVTAPMPVPAFPKSLASPSAVAFLMSQKYVEGLPLYRQEKSLERLGLFIPRQTMANWMIKGADDWLKPMYQRLKHHLLEMDVLQADETTLQVIKEPERKAERKSYIWLYRSGHEGPPIILFDYQMTREAKHPQAFLAGFAGYLHVDGYQGYESLDNVILQGCWSHVRRKFKEALAAMPPSARALGKLTAAAEGRNFCNALFKIERSLRHVKAAERHAARQQRSRPVINAMKIWLEKQSEQSLPKSAFGQAITYCCNQWSKLIVFLEDGRLEIDNNRSERSIKPFVMGRKNWLFAFTPKGATASAIIYSMVETAKENKLDPRKYLQFLFEKMPQLNLKDEKVLDELLPWSETAQLECKIPDKPTA